MKSSFSGPLMVAPRGLIHSHPYGGPEFPAEPTFLISQNLPTFFFIVGLFLVSKHTFPLRLRRSSPGRFRHIRARQFRRHRHLATLPSAEVGVLSLGRTSGRNPPFPPRNDFQIPFDHSATRPDPLSCPAVSISLAP